MNQDEISQLVAEFRRLQNTHAQTVGELAAVKACVGLLLAMTVSKPEATELEGLVRSALLFLGGRTEIAGFGEDQSAGFHAASAFLLEAARLPAKIGPQELLELIRQYPDRLDIGRRPA